MNLLYPELTREIMDCAYKVHTFLGPGLLESSYEECLLFEIASRKLEVRSQVPMPLIYEDVRLETAYRIDILVEGLVILELKSVDAIIPIHIAQLLTYLKLSGCRIGFLINFNVESLKDGIRRFIV